MEKTYFLKINIDLSRTGTELERISVPILRNGRERVRLKSGTERTERKEPDWERNGTRSIKKWNFGDTGYLTLTITKNFSKAVISFVIVFLLVKR